MGFAMTEVTLDIKQWGNNLGVRLPAAIAREANLHVHQQVRITVIDERIVIVPVADEQLTLEQRLADFDLKLHGGEAMPSTKRHGAEVW